MTDRSIRIPARGFLWRGPILLVLLATPLTAFAISIAVFGTMAVLRGWEGSRLSAFAMAFAFLFCGSTVAALAFAAWKWAFLSAFIETTLELSKSEIVIRREWWRSTTIRISSDSVESLLITDLFHPKVCLELLAILSGHRTVQLCTGPSGEELSAIMKAIAEVAAVAQQPKD